MIVPMVRTRPFPIDVDDDDDGGFCVIAPIAKDTTYDQIVTVDSHMKVSVHEGENFWDFLFEISITQMEDDSEPVSTMDRELAKKWIPDEIRSIVMDIVCDSCRALVWRVKPDRIYRVTKVPDPPDAALKKHRALTEVLQELGYDVTETGYDRWDRVFWVLDRRAY